MDSIWKDIEVLDWETLECILEEELGVDWSGLPEGRDLFVEDLIRVTEGRSK